MHYSVLLKESVDALPNVVGGIYVDGTFGRGGHSRLLLSELDESSRLIAFDKDLAAHEYAQQNFADESRLKLVHDSFANMSEQLKLMGLLGQVDGLMLDLGVSSPQLDEADRGFSFMHDGPLDMRMNQNQSLTAAVFLAQATTSEIAKVLKFYGEEKFAQLIASRIVERRVTHPFETTRQLADFVEAVIPSRAQNRKPGAKAKHPATRTFQAIRIHINDELKDVERLLADAVDILKVGGRLVVISFHSLEDRLVKRFIKSQEKGPLVPRNIPVIDIARPEHFISVGKAIKAADAELGENIRSRSAVLRVAEKVAAVDGVVVEVSK
jgi:16S rRNA (cytosine1402-N4)-methyltransferase